MNFSNKPVEKNVVYITEESKVFSDIYIAVRKKEQRVLSDKEVEVLPYLNRNEWRFREKSTERFINYIASKKEGLKILDIGCGNGWFTNAIAKVSKKNKVIGLDLNREELEQAARIFQKKNLQFAYGDTFKIKALFKQQFDIITLNSSVQYFSELKSLLSTLKSFLKPNGEIHIIDSPFYKKDKIANAKERTITYFTKLGFPEMASHYFHHSMDSISEFEALYTYKRNFIKMIFRKKDTPFTWYRYKAN